MTNYLETVDDSQDLTIAISYLGRSAHEWWTVFKETEERRAVMAWCALKNAFVYRSDTLSKEKIARDKISR